MTKALRTLLASAVIGGALLSPLANAAGFHYQLDLTAKLQSDEAGKLNALQMSWIYDKELSAVLMDGEDLSEANREATLKKRAKDILEGLTGVGYFTTVLVDDQAITNSEVTDYNVQITDEDRLQVNMALPFETAQELKGHVLKVVVSDATAVGLATFLTRDNLILGDAFDKLCKKPELDQKQVAEMDGHVQMADTMTVDCR